MSSKNSPLAHPEEAEKFYRDLAARDVQVRVGMEASEHARWFERLLRELNFEFWLGDAAICCRFASLQADDKALSYAQAQLRATASYAASRRLGPVANSFTEIGPVVETIVTLAIRLKVDLIVLGASAPRTLRDRLGGTTAYRVVCTAPCPVLTVRAPSPLAYFERLFAVMPKT